MRLEELVVIWRVDGERFIRSTSLVDINLNHFDNKFMCDGAVHDAFRNSDHNTRINWLASIIEKLLTLGYEMEYIHFNLICIEGYPQALGRLNEKHPQPTSDAQLL